MQKVIVFGLGNTYRKYKELICSEFEIVGYSDNHLRPTDLEGTFIGPDILPNNPEIKILICAHDGYVDVFRQMINSGFSKEQILNIYDISSRIVIDEWRSAGSIIPPPPEYKRMLIKQYAEKFNCRILIETGTYYGETIESQLLHFDTIASIELAENLYRASLEKFDGIDFVHLYCGDSGDLIESVIHNQDASRGTLFWLDGHYSGGETACGVNETPIIKEIETISKCCTSGMVLIDDARCFDGQNGYPTIDYLKLYMNKNLNILTWENNYDVVRCAFGNE